ADNPQLWSPGIKLGVRPGSFFHRTECFGPVLGLMRANTLDQAVDLANAQPFGLTSGIQTLDDREIARWVDRIEAGKLYVQQPSPPAPPSAAGRPCPWGPAPRPAARTTSCSSHVGTR